MKHLGLTGTPIKYLASEVRELNLDLAEDNLLSLSYGRVVRKDINSNEGLLPNSFERYTKVQTGDTVLRLTDLQNDQRSLRTGRVSEAGIITSAYLSLRPSSACDSRFLAYCLHAMDIGKVFYALGGGLRQSMGIEEVGNLRIPLPPLEEQRRIADFLDDRVTRIDSIVAARAKQIEVYEVAALARYRDLTSSDVTGAGWRIAHAFATGSGTTPSSDRTDFFDGDIPWVASGDLNDFELSATARTVTTTAMTAYPALKMHPPGSLLVAMYGATVGKTGLLTIEACVNQAVCALVPTGPVDPAFAQYWFISRRPEILTLASGGGQPNISQEIVRSLRMRVGDRAWQADRLQELNEVRRETSLATSSMGQSIGLLNEYKRSLITAAVTGELDVSTAGSGVPA